MCRLLPVALALAAAVSAAKQTAPTQTAPTPTMAIVELDAPPAMLGLSTQTIRAVLAEATRQKLTVLGPDVLREKLGNARFNDLVKCGDRPACAAQALEGLGVTRAVLGKMARTEKNYVLQLYLLDLKELSVITSVDRSILIASRRLQKDVEAAVPGFLRGEHEAHGALQVNVTVVNAQVTINGEFVGATPLEEQQLKPGKYEVKVEKKKYLPVTRLVNVEPNQKTVEEIRLLLMPGQLPDDEVAPLVAKKSDGVEDRPIHLSAPTWVAGAATVVAAGAGLYFGLSSSGLEKDLLAGFDSTAMVYAGTRAQALKAQSQATIANVMFGVAGAALVATIVFAILDGIGFWDSGDTSTIEVTPAPAAGGGGLLLGGHF